MIEILTVIAIIGIVSGILVIGLRSVSGSSQRNQTIALLDRLNNAMTELTNSPAAAQKMYTVQLPMIYFPEPANRFQDSIFKTWIGVPASALESQVRTAQVLDYIVASNPAAKSFLEGLPPERRGKFTTPVTNANAAAYTPRSPVPLDAWGNPILFVFDGLQIATGTNTGRPFTVKIGGGTEEEPVGGLTNLYSDSDKSYYESEEPLDPAPTYTFGALNAGQQKMPNPPAPYVRPAAYRERMTPTGAHEHALRSPDRRPFWASAGPDGKYETHDDNVYSFGN
jgi:type II secretory pathway pseudopilin PulG